MVHLCFSALAKLIRKVTSKNQIGFLYTCSYVASCFHLNMYEILQTQTDDDGDKFLGLAKDVSGGLGEFMSRVEPYISKLLERNNKSRAFDGKLII